MNYSSTSLENLLISCALYTPVVFSLKLAMNNISTKKKLSKSTVGLFLGEVKVGIRLVAGVAALWNKVSYVGMDVGRLMTAVGFKIGGLKGYHTLIKKGWFEANRMAFKWLCATVLWIVPEWYGVW